MTALPLRVGTYDDWQAISQLMLTAFHENWDGDANRAEWRVFEPARSLVVTDGDTLVGHAAAYSRELSVPGAVVPAAHVTMVGVLPTHRRRGLLTQMMHRQLAEITEPIAVLWASQGAIYPRFGYGLAAPRLAFSIDTGTRLPEPQRAGRLRMAAPRSVLAELAGAYELVRAHRPGWSSRDESWWHYTVSDPPSGRQGATELRAVLHDGPAGCDGYAMWRVKNDGSPEGPSSTVLVKEVVAADLDVYLTLWRFLTSIDLTRRANVWNGSLEEPLLHLVEEPRRLGATLADGLFLRIIDLPAALTARRYAIEVDLVLEVTDALRPGNAGRWHLVADLERATCEPTTAPADLACDIADLSAAYLGGTRLAVLAAAGRVRPRTPAALAMASAGFGWHPAPAGLEIF
jgi:predicted acetyltransferase